MKDISKLNRFVVLEGCEGSGKTTQMNRIRAKYPDATYFREPGGTDFAEKEMRRLLLTSDYAADLTPFEAMALFFAGRSHNLRTIVAPALAQGKAVFADRFDGSSFAYQIHGMEGSALVGHFDSFRKNMGSSDYLPGLYIVLDVSPEVGMARVKKRAADKGEHNHFDARGAEFHARVREGYRRFAEHLPGMVVMVNAERTPDEIWSDVEKILERFFENR